MNWRANAERDREAASASSATVQACPGSAWTARSAAPTRASAEARNQPGAVAVLRREVLAEDLHERHIQQTIEQGLLAGLVAQHLAGEEVQRGSQRAPSGGSHRQQIRQRGQQALGQVAVEPVGAAEERRGRAVARSAEAHAIRDARPGCHHLGRRAARRPGRVGQVLRRGVAHQRDVAGQEPHRSVGVRRPQVDLALDDDVDRQRGAAAEAHPPGAMRDGPRESRSARA